MNTNEIFAKRVRALRKELGITQEELAKMCNFKGKSAIAQIEKGHCGAKSDRLVNIANALNTSVDYLLGNDENKIVIEFSNEEIKKRLLSYYDYLKTLEK